MSTQPTLHRPGLRKSHSYRTSSSSTITKSEQETSGPSRTRSSSSDRLVEEPGENAQSKRHGSQAQQAQQAGGFHRVHSRQHMKTHRHPTRNLSHGKNLSKLAKFAAVDPAAVVAATAAAQRELHHKRSRSHDPSIQLSLRDKAVAKSAKDLQKAAERKTAAEKGYSSDEVGQLEVDESDEDDTDDDAMPVLNTSRKSSSRALANNASNGIGVESQNKKSKDEKVTGKFDLETEDAEAGWTETSESQSPADSRTATKYHSPSASQSGWNPAVQPASGPAVDAAVTEAFEKQRLATAAAAAAKDSSNGVSGSMDNPRRGEYPGRKVSALGLLPSGHPPNLEPQLSNISVVSAGGQTIGSSTMSDATLFAPSMDSVSKFITGGSSSTGPSRDTSRIGIKDMATPGSSSRKGNNGGISSEPGRVRQNVSFATPTNPTPSKSANGLSSTYSQPQIPSRTQQKLWLQRASSNMEPKPIPASAFNGMASLRSTGSNLSIGIGGHGMGGHGIGVDGKDPRLQREIDRTAREYIITCKYKRPTSEKQFALSSGNGSTGGLLGRKQKSTTPATTRVNGNTAGANSKGAEHQALLTGAGQVSQSQHSHPQDPPADIEVTQDGRQVAGGHKARSSLDRFDSDERDSVTRSSSSKTSDAANGIDRLLQRYWDRVEILGTD